METLLSQADNLPGLLAASRSGEVRSWDTESLRRALNWARYFQQLHGRFCTKPKPSQLRTALRRRLRRGGLGLGHLKRCPELLGLTLLENRALPPAACQGLLHGLLFPGAAEGGEEEEEALNPPLLARRKAASQLLSLAPLTPAPPGVSPSLRAQGQLLLARLREEQGEVEETGGGARGDVFSAAAFLQQLQPSPTLYKAAAAALLQEEEEEDAAAAARATLLSWLLQDNCPPTGRLADFCRLLPASWMASLCSRCPDLRAPYLSLLTAWGQRLYYDPLCGEWRVHGLEAGGVAWQEMCERLSCLIRAPEPLAGAVEKHLRDLRAQDGDFQVRGLSLWTDLLDELEKEFRSKTFHLH